MSNYKGAISACQSSPVRRVVYALLGAAGAVFLCGGCIGLWLLLRPDPFLGPWQSRDAQGRDAITLGLYAERNGEKTGFYRAGEGKSQSLRWRLDGDVLELELDGDRTFWTGEKVARFTYFVSWSGRELTLTPTTAGQRPVTLKSTKRPFPT